MPGSDGQTATSSERTREVIMCFLLTVHPVEGAGGGGGLGNGGLWHESDN